MPAQLTRSKSLFGFGADDFMSRRCDSWNCLSSGVCGVSEAVPRHFGVWVYIVVAFGIFGGKNLCFWFLRTCLESILQGCLVHFSVFSLPIGNSVIRSEKSAFSTGVNK